MFVIANVGTPADAEHAEKKRGENDLNAKEKPGGPEKNLANLIERTEATSRPSPGDVSTTNQAGEEKLAAKDQSCFKSYAFEKAFQGNGAAVEAGGVAEYFGKGSDG